MINIINISKKFSQLDVLNNINLFIEGNKIISILGPSGSGKTTLLRCITGLDKDFKGSITIKQEPQEKFLLNQKIALVSQNYSNFEWLTVKENIEIAYKNKANHNIDKIIENVGLKGFENYFPSQLSGGMKQRLAIGRAFAQNTDILAMDEPFGALDYQTRHNLQILIKELNTKFNKTIIFVTHDIEEAIFISDRIIILSKIPSIIVKDYDVSSIIKSISKEELIYSKEFLNLRQEIENDLKLLDLLQNINLNSLNNISMDFFNKIDYYNSFFVTQIRKSIEKINKNEILHFIQKLLKSNEKNLKILGSLLSRDSEVDLDTLSIISNLFSESEIFEEKFFYLHTLSNYNSSNKKDLYDFVLNNLEEYILLEKKYLSANFKFNDSILNHLEYKIKSNENKKWLLLISSLTYSNNEKVKLFLNKYLNDNDLFIIEVVKNLLNIIEKNLETKEN